MHCQIRTFTRSESVMSRPLLSIRRYVWLLVDVATSTSSDEMFTVLMRAMRC